MPETEHNEGRIYIRLDGSPVEQQHVQNWGGYQQHPGYQQGYSGGGQHQQPHQQQQQQQYYSQPQQQQNYPQQQQHQQQHHGGQHQAQYDQAEKIGKEVPSENPQEAHEHVLPLRRACSEAGHAMLATIKPYPSSRVAQATTSNPPSHVCRSKILHRINQLDLRS